MHEILNRLIVSVACVSVVLLSAATASAFEVTARLNTTSTVIANGFVDNGNGTITANLTAGDIIAIDVFAANAAGDTITGAFTSLAYDSVQSTFQGGGFTGGILQAASCTGFMCTPPTLDPAVSVQSKPNDPLSQGTGTEDWIQVIGHTNTAGTNGTGAAAPGDLATQLAFLVTAGGAGTGQVDFTVAKLAGDAVSNGVTSETYTSLRFNVPEPGAFAASLAALGSVALVTNRRRRRE